MNPSKLPQIEAYLKTLPYDKRFLLNGETAKSCNVGKGTLHRAITHLMSVGKVTRIDGFFKWNSNGTQVELSSSSNPSGTQVELIKPIDNKEQMKWNSNGTDTTVPVQVELHNNNVLCTKESTKNKVRTQLCSSSSSSSGTQMELSPNPLDALRELESEFNRESELLRRKTLEVRISNDAWASIPKSHYFNPIELTRFVRHQWEHAPGMNEECFNLRMSKFRESLDKLLHDDMDDFYSIKKAVKEIEDNIPVTV